MRISMPVLFGFRNPFEANQMFSIHVETLDKNVLLAISRMFIDMANTTPTNVKLTGAQYIASLDLPDAGTPVAPSAAAAFAASPVAGKADAAAAFAAHVHQAATAAPADDTPIMTAAATNTYDEYIAAGWTDDTLIASGFMVAPVPNVTAAPFTAAVDPSATVQGVTGATSTGTGTAPPPPAPTAASSAQTAAAPPPPTNPALRDSAGMAWDARIHASTRTCKADGTWKAKKGVDANLVAEVTAQQRAATGQAPAVAMTPLNAAPPPPPPAAVANVAPPPPPPPAATGAAVMPHDFVSMCQYATSKFKPPQIFAVCEKNGIQSLGQINGNLHLIPQMFADFEALR